MSRPVIPVALIADLRAAGGRRLPLALALSLVLALAEGMGIGLLAPLLVASGFAGHSTTLPAWMAPFASLPLDVLLPLWLACVLAVTVLSAWRDCTNLTLREDVVCHLRVNLHAVITAMEWKSFQAERASDIVAALTQSIFRVGQIVIGAMTLCARLASILVQLALALLISPVATAVAALMGGMFIAAQGSGFRKILSRGQATGRSARAFHATITEHLGGMKLAKAHHAEAGFHQDFRDATLNWRADQVSVTTALIWSRAVGKSLIAIALALLVWSAIHHLDIPAPLLLVLIGILVRLLPAFSDALHQSQIVTESLPAWRDLEDLRQRLTLAREQPVEELCPPACPEGDLVLDRVGFTWPGRDRPALSEVSLVIGENRTTALIGPSGGGKSTLADLCAGLLIPDTGMIRVGSHPLDGQNRAGWRRRLAYVPQDTFLLHDSVRANLSWLAPQAGEADLWQALTDAALEPTIRALPQGLDTIIGDRGVRLSGGERQRLAIARALLRRPRMLVLDEATSHLDHVSEALLQQVLQALNGRMTVLVVAHRLNTIRHADQIAIIDGGTVRAQCGWDELGDVSAGWLEG
ncbi:MAG: ABC transporter ATP-binding protein [Magnetospirillum sp.]|nr:ABC transporter ATP-binding protein [Magnetospirillum sp.]